MKLLLLVCAVAISTCLRAADFDVIKLTDGSLFQGKVKDVVACAVVFKTAGITYHIPATDIEAIAFGDVESKVYQQFVALSASPADDCMAGRSDAAMYHGKKGGHFVLGFLFGPFAMLGTALATPSPDRGARTYLRSENRELFTDPEYLTCYRKKAKGQLLGAEAVGWASWILLLLLI